MIQSDVVVPFSGDVGSVSSGYDLSSGWWP